jgi:hypothetical protein
MVLELLALSLAFADSAPMNELVTDCPVVAGSPFCEVRSGWIIKPGIGLSDPAMLYGPDGRFRYPLMSGCPAQRRSGLKTLHRTATVLSWRPPSATRMVGGRW